MMLMDKLMNELIACETAVWEALVTGDAAADAAALSADFLGVYPDGFAGRDSHTGQLSNGPTVASYQLSEARVMPLGPDHALLAYRASFVRTGRERREGMFVSSIWRRCDDGWTNIFSQDTPATGQAVP
ncbi:MAG: nuclear transport factor 2 family protein [Pararhodobacter sp.]|nr:nuclear transport factor 2 family protein [Pararhodobacter sp.]